jgi:hypothetical protein
VFHRWVNDLVVGSALLAAPLAAPAELQPSTVASISVEGTEFVVTLTNGDTRRSGDLIGTWLDVRFGNTPAKIRIRSVERDPADASGTIWLHILEQQQPDGAWRNLCAPGPDGHQEGFPLPGPDGLQFTCASDAIGKCVRFGYRPWVRETDGFSLAVLHAACVHLMRGDYGGSGERWARDGVPIDISDPLGIQKPDDEADLAFEAGWTPAGAVCVHHIRANDSITLAALEQKYPKLKGRVGAICTEDYARSLGALVFNRSRPREDDARAER